MFCYYQTWRQGLELPVTRHLIPAHPPSTGKHPAMLQQEVGFSQPRESVELSV